MTHLFYLFALLFLVYELHWLMYPKQCTIDSRAAIADMKDKKKLDTCTEETKGYMLSHGCFMFFVLGWLLLGLISHQWPIFLLFIAWQMLFSLLKKISANTGYHIGMNILNTIAGIALSGFVVLNHYHLHIDLVALFLSKFNHAS